MSDSVFHFILKGPEDFLHFSVLEPKVEYAQQVLNHETSEGVVSYGDGLRKPIQGLHYVVFKFRFERLLTQLVFAFLSQTLHLLDGFEVRESKIMVHLIIVLHVPERVLENVYDTVKNLSVV